MTYETERASVFSFQIEVSETSPKNDDGTESFSRRPDSLPPVRLQAPFALSVSLPSV